jgi:hypothetical protein
VATADGGKTWKGLDGTGWPSSLGGNISKVTPRPVDIGGNVAGIFPFGCGGLSSVHIGYPADRVFFVRSVYTNDGWWVSPKFFVSGDSRHCHDVRWGDIVAGANGRLWAAWFGKSRDWYEDGPQLTFVYHSDDGGASWSSWRGAGFSGTIPSALGPRIRLAPYRGGIALFSDKGWSWFDGTKWSEPEKACWSGGAQQVTALGEEIYVADGSGAVKRYDGKSWSAFSVPDRAGKNGKIGVCGGSKLVFVETDAGGKKLLCWSKSADGAWQGPQELIEEQTKIVTYAIQRYAPEGFMPVAYMCLSGDQAGAKPWKKLGSGEPYEVLEPWIKVLRMPSAIRQ